MYLDDKFNSDRQNSNVIPKNENIDKLCLFSCSDYQRGFNTFPQLIVDHLVYPSNPISELGPLVWVWVGP